MKNLISFITLLIFLHTTTYYMIVTEAKEGLPDPVRDTDGDELRASVGLNIYFIRPVIPGMGGGVVGVPAKGFCQYAVTQQNFDYETGRALSFFPAGYKDGDVVYESTDMNIAFFLSFGCQTSIWKVDDYDESTKQYFVMQGGVLGNPGNETLSNWFKIEKVATGDHDYKIVFCPSVCDLCAVVCSDVGIYVENGLRRLALSDVPFLVRFQKARFDHKKY